MAPRPRTGWDPHTVPPGLRDAAALVLVYPLAGVASIALTVRGDALRNHTGQVSLPGGGVDLGESLEEAALREAAEEIGVPPESVQIVGRLTSLHIPVSGYLLHPFVGVADVRPDFLPAEHEVARLLEVPIDRLLGRADTDRELRTLERRGKSVEVDVPFFAVDAEKVWGATAMILAEFLEVYRNRAR